MKNFKLLEDNEKKVFVWVIIAAFVLRLLFLFEIISTPFASYLFSDSKLFLNLADSFFTSEFWSNSDPFLISPLYPVILSVFRVFFGDNNFFIYLLQVIISTATLIFIYFTAKNLFDKNVAIISLLIAAFFDSYVFYSGLILSGTLEIFIFTLLIYFLSEKEILAKYKNWLFIGLYLGLLILLRESYLLVAAVILLYINFNKNFSVTHNLSKQKVSSFIAGGLLIVVLPITLINIYLSNEFILTDAGEGIYFYFANNNTSNGLFPIDSHDFIADPAGKDLASGFLGEKVSARTASNYFYGKTLTEIFDNPINFLALAAQKAVLFFDINHHPKSSITDIKFYESNFSDILKLPLVSYGLISLFFLIGLLFYVNTKEKNHFIFLLFISFYVMILLSFANVQYKMAVTSIMIIVASFGIVNVYKCIVEAKFNKLKIPVLISLFIILLNSLFIEKQSITNYDAYYYFGKYLEENEKYEEAIYNFNRSILLNDRYKTLLALGNTFAKKKDYTNALAAFGEAEKRRDDDYYLYFNKGIVLAQTGQYDKALDAYNKSLKLNPSYYPIFRNIGIVFYVNENYNEAIKFFNKFLSLSDDEVTNALVRKDIENIKLKLRDQ